MTEEKTIEVRVITPPDKFKENLEPGDTVKLDVSMAKTWIQNGYAEEVAPEPNEGTPSPKTLEDAGYTIRQGKKKNVIVDSENKAVYSFTSTGTQIQKDISEKLGIPLEAVQASLLDLDLQQIEAENTPQDEPSRGRAPPDPSAVKVPSPGNGRTCEQIQGNGAPEYVFYRPPNEITKTESISYDHFNPVMQGDESVTYVPMPLLPWPACGKLIEPGDTLWTDIRQFIWDHVYFADDRLYDVVTAWIYYTYISEAFHVAPYIKAYGPKNVGKTILLECLYYLSYRAVLSPSVSEAALFRLLESYHVTFLLDETEHYMAEVKQAIQNVLNSGYRRGQSVLRCTEAPNGEQIVVGYQVFGPKGLAGTEELSDTLESRCIQIVMEKKQRDVNFKLDISRAKTLRSRLLLWRFRRQADLESLDIIDSIDTFDALTEAPEPLRGISDGRIQEIYAPLVTLAETEETRNNIAGYARDSFEDTKTEAATSSEAQILLAMISAAETKLDSGRLSTKDIATEFNLDRPEKEQWKSYSIGRSIKKLGFKPARGIKGGRAWLYDRDRVDKLCVTYDLDPSVKASKTSETSKMSSQQTLSEGSEDNPNIDHLRRVAETQLKRAGYMARADFFNFMHEAGHPNQDVILSTLRQDPRYEITDKGVKWMVEEASA